MQRRGRLGLSIACSDIVGWGKAEVDRVDLDMTVAEYSRILGMFGFDIPDPGYRLGFQCSW